MLYSFQQKGFRKTRFTFFKMRLLKWCEKFVAGSVAICFFASLLLPSPVALAQPEGLAISSFVPLGIPSELAKIEEAFIPDGQIDSAPPLIHIQSVHAHPETQRKIYALLKFLDEKYGIDSMFIEGAGEKLNPNYFRFFEDNRLNVRVAEKLVEKGELTGAELFLIESPREIPAYGIEDPALYRRNLTSFQYVMRQRPATTRFTKDLRGSLDRLETLLLKKEARKLLRSREAFDSGQMELLSYALELERAARAILGVDIRYFESQLDWPQMIRLLRLQEVEAKLDPEKIQAERQSLVNYLLGNGIDQDLAQGFENLSFSPYQSGMVYDPGFRRNDLPRYLAERLVEATLEKGFAFEQYPDFTRYLEAAILQSELEAGRLFEEIERLFDKIMSAVSGEAEDKKFVGLVHKERLYERLFDLELTPKDYAKIQTENSEERPLIRFLLDLESLHEKTPLGKRKLIPSNSDTLESIFGEARRFYELAKQREETMVEKILSSSVIARSPAAGGTPKQSQIASSSSSTPSMTRTRNDGQGVTVLITGGFHTAGLSHTFREKKIPYTILTPRITEKVNSEDYVSALLGEKKTAFDTAHLEDSLHFQRSEVRFGEMWTPSTRLAKQRSEFRVVLEGLADVSQREKISAAKFASDFSQSLYGSDRRAELRLSPEGDRLIPLLDGKPLGFALGTSRFVKEFFVPAPVALPLTEGDKLLTRSELRHLPQIELTLEQREALDKNAQTVFDFLAAHEKFEVETDEWKPIQANAWRNEGPFDFVIVFGSSYREAAEGAARIAKQAQDQNSNVIIIPSGRGPVKRPEWYRPYTLVKKGKEVEVPEAEFFAVQMVKAGVKENNIIPELEATDTGKNTRNVRKIFDRLRKERHLGKNLRVLFLQNGRGQKRGGRSFVKQFNDDKSLAELEIEKVVSLSPFSLEASEMDDATVVQELQKAVGEIGRFDAYATQGFVDPIQVPDEVSKAITSLQTAFPNFFPVPRRSEVRAKDKGMARGGPEQKLNEFADSILRLDPNQNQGVIGRLQDLVRADREFFSFRKHILNDDLARSAEGLKALAQNHSPGNGRNTGPLAILYRMVEKARLLTENGSLDGILPSAPRSEVRGSLILTDDNLRKIYFDGLQSVQKNNRVQIRFFSNGLFDGLFWEDSVPKDIAPKTSDVNERYWWEQTWTQIVTQWAETKTPDESHLTPPEIIFEHDTRVGDNIVVQKMIHAMEDVLERYGYVHEVGYLGHDGEFIERLGGGFGTRKIVFSTVKIPATPTAHRFSERQDRLTAVAQAQMTARAEVRAEPTPDAAGSKEDEATEGKVVGILVTKHRLNDRQRTTLLFYMRGKLSRISAIQEISEADPQKLLGIIKAPSLVTELDLLFQKEQVSQPVPKEPVEAELLKKVARLLLTEWQWVELVKGIRGNLSRRVNTWKELYERVLNALPPESRNQVRSRLPLNRIFEWLAVDPDQPILKTTYTHFYESLGGALLKAQPYLKNVDPLVDALMVMVGRKKENFLTQEEAEDLAFKTFTTKEFVQRTASVLGVTVKLTHWEEEIRRAEVRAASAKPEPIEEILTQTVQGIAERQKEAPQEFLKRSLAAFNFLKKSLLELQQDLGIEVVETLAEPGRPLGNEPEFKVKAADGTEIFLRLGQFGLVFDTLSRQDAYLHNPHRIVVFTPFRTEFAAFNFDKKKEDQFFYRIAPLTLRIAIGKSGKPVAIVDDKFKKELTIAQIKKLSPIRILTETEAEQESFLLEIGIRTKTGKEAVVGTQPAAQALVRRSELRDQGPLGLSQEGDLLTPPKTLKTLTARAETRIVTGEGVIEVGTFESLLPPVKSIGAAFVLPEFPAGIMLALAEPPAILRSELRPGWSSSIAVATAIGINKDDPVMDVSFLLARKFASAVLEALKLAEERSVGMDSRMAGMLKEEFGKNHRVAGIVHQISQHPTVHAMVFDRPPSQNGLRAVLAASKLNPYSRVVILFMPGASVTEDDLKALRSEAGKILPLNRITIHRPLTLDDFKTAISQTAPEISSQRVVFSVPAGLWNQEPAIGESLRKGVRAVVYNLRPSAVLLGAVAYLAVGIGSEALSPDQIRKFIDLENPGRYRANEENLGTLGVISVLRAILDGYEKILASA